MKKMKIEKQLVFADHVNRIVSLQVTENLTYRHEDDGIRAMGPLYIKGQYEGDDGVEKFQETLEMDVLAPNNKLSGEDFHLQVGDFQGNANDDSIQITITMDITGLIEETGGNKQPRTVTPQPKQPVTAPKPEIKEPVKEVQVPRVPVMDTYEVMPPVAEPIVEAVNPSEEPQGKPPVDDFEDLFADAESTYTSYRIIVAKPNDTYTAIAQRYDVDETALRDTNKNKEILPKTLVILPFQQK